MNNNSVPTISSRPHKKKCLIGGIIKYFFIILCVLILLILGAIVGILYTTDPQQLVHKVSDLLEKEYDRELKIEHLSISLFKGIYMKGIALSKKGGFQNGKAITFTEGSMLYNPFALLGGKLDIILLSVTGLYNYEDPIELIKSFIPVKTDTRKEKGLLTFAIRNIEIKNSQFMYNKIPLNFTASISPEIPFNHSKISLYVNSMYGTLSFHGRLNQGRLVIYELNLDRLINKELGVKVKHWEAIVKMISEQEYEVIGKIATIDYKNLSLAATSQLSAYYHIRNQVAIIRNCGFKMGNSKFYIQRLVYTIPMNKVDVDISSLNIILSDFIPKMPGRITGNLSFIYGKKLLLNGIIGITNLSVPFVNHLDAVLRVTDNAAVGSAVIDTSGGRFYADLTSKDISTSELVFEVNTDSLDVYPFLLNFKDLQKKHQAALSTSQSLELPFPIPDIRLIFSADQAKFQKLMLSDLKLSGSYKKAGITLDAVTDFLMGNLKLNASWRGVDISGTISYSDGKLREFSKVFLKENEKLYGTISLSGSYHISTKDITGSSAELSATCINGEIRGFEIQKKLAEVLYDIPIYDIFFDKINLKTKLNNKRLTDLEFNFDSDQIVIIANGEMNIETKQLDIKMEVSLAKDYISSLPNVTTIFTQGMQKNDRIIFKVNITGTLDKPKIKMIN